MNPETIYFVLHEILCGMLFYTVFCRSVRSDEDVRTDVRLAFLLMATVACAGIVCPIFYGAAPSLFTILLLASMVFVQWVTEIHWRHGVPEQFLKHGRAPRDRRRCDRNNLTIGA